MNQVYAEAGVKRANSGKVMALRALLYMGIVMGVIITFFGGLFGIIGVVVIVILCYLLPRLNVEFEYVYVDGQIDFDKIMGKAKRKTMLRIDFEQVEIMAPMKSHSLDGYTHVNLEVKDFSSGLKDNKTYAIIANVNNKKTKIFFQPSEVMIDVIKHRFPRKISQF